MKKLILLSCFIFIFIFSGKAQDQTTTIDEKSKTLLGTFIFSNQAFNYEYVRFNDVIGESHSLKVFKIGSNENKKREIENKLDELKDIKSKILFFTPQSIIDTLKKSLNKNDDKVTNYLKAYVLEKKYINDVKICRDIYQGFEEILKEKNDSTKIDLLFKH